MKNKDRLMLLFSVLFLVFVVLIFINGVKIETPTVEQETTVESRIDNRQSITFILGEDHGNENNFYQNAEAYFKYNPNERSDEIITDARSLNEMIALLNENFLKSATPYNDIHVVVHSNPWAGISLPLNEGEERLNADRLNDAIANLQVTDLNPQLADENTQVHIHACGLGQNRALLDALRRSMNGLNIVASDGYVNFKAENERYIKSEMEVYYAFFPTAYKPADLHLARQLAKRYPNTDKDWMKAMEHYSYQYNIPVEWEIQYPEYDVPELADDVDKMEWLMNQDELMNIVEKTEIPFDNFRWIVKKTRDSVKVYGKVTVLCVLEEMKV
ncbi:hypothetical protein [Portibacter lacus]|uniref:DUF4347 domain-containing protein n=1 Tax=Portibacter lacus TaxID=1099794 RepID=A0AA37SR92_9BACT|nr:hypothetical protein [Portibacter lacus]GLR18572.1 hypothetical protein GCM10007940_31880 [Portibacter lacus]